MIVLVVDPWFWLYFLWGMGSAGLVIFIWDVVKVIKMSKVPKRK